MPWQYYFTTQTSSTLLCIAYEYQPIHILCTYYIYFNMHVEFILNNKNCVVLDICKHIKSSVQLCLTSVCFISAYNWYVIFRYFFWLQIKNESLRKTALRVYWRYILSIKHILCLTQLYCIYKEHDREHNAVHNNNINNKIL
jgi:hypothetical protein